MNMRITKLELENFRLFKHLSVDFSESMGSRNGEVVDSDDSGSGSVAVLVAANGKGKTAVLEGLKLLLGSFLSKFSGIASIAPKESDYRKEWTLKSLHANSSVLSVELKELPQAPYMRLAAEAEFPSGIESNAVAHGPYVNWDILRKRDKSKSTAEAVPQTVGLKGIGAQADRIIDADNAQQPIEMPIVAYYNTERAVIRKKPQRRRNFKKAFKRSDAYVGALDGELDYKGLIEWVSYVEEKQRREREAAQDFLYRSLEMQTIRLATERMLPGFGYIRTVLPLNLVVDVDDGHIRKTCLIDSQLSDGYRIVLVLVLNLVSRILEANAALPGMTPERLLAASGVVLIDEIDQHLHPSWQQRIVPDLRKTFPNFQFIVTTHSPQVISSVRSNSVYVIRDGEVNSLEKVQQTQGLDANQLLIDVFGAPIAAPSKERELLDEYAEMLENGQGFGAQGDAIYSKLLSYFGENDPVMSLVKYRREALGNA